VSFMAEPTLVLSAGSDPMIDWVAGAAASPMPIATRRHGPR
jgi:hypothetical protein